MFSAVMCVDLFIRGSYLDNLMGLGELMLQGKQDEGRTHSEEMRQYKRICDVTGVIVVL